MADFVHQRHKPPTPLERSRELVVVCAPMRSNVNLSQIARTAGCCGVERLILCGNARLVPKIARDAGEHLEVEVRRTLPPVLERLRDDGYQLVGLEQTTAAESAHHIELVRRTALVVGNERKGIEPEALALLDRVLEIPVYGRPFSYNVAIATAMALYEYCRQFPDG